MDIRHTPVLVDEVLAALKVRAGGTYIDCTVGEGGHAEAVLKAAEPGPRLLGIDLDATALETARGRVRTIGRRVELVQGSFAELQLLASEHGFLGADGVLFDLGLSSLQLETPERGFSFSRSGRLDMGFDATQKVTASQIVNGLTEEELADTIYKLGEEPRSRRIARSIVEARPVETTIELAEAVVRATGFRGRRRLHPATRTFQAIRMAVNKELDNLQAGLQSALQVLGSGGRLVVISYHSLEDRLVKRLIQREASTCICPPETPECVCGHQPSIRRVSRRVIKASQEEVRANPRSRSARLRVAELL